MENICNDYGKLLSQSKEHDDQFFLKVEFWLGFSIQLLLLLFL